MQVRHPRKDHRAVWGGQSIDKTHYGTLSELRTAIDLLTRGFHVFNNFSHCGPFDLIAVQSGDRRQINIEVRGGYVLKNGGVRAMKPNASDTADVLAIHVPGHGVFYHWASDRAQKAYRKLIPDAKPPYVAGDRHSVSSSFS